MSRFPDHFRAFRPSWQSPTETVRPQGPEADVSDEIAQARAQRLLSGAQAALRHALAFRDMDALHRIALQRSHFNPNQPRVPAGNPDGGQWTSEGGGVGTRLAAADKPHFGPGTLFFMLIAEPVRRLIEAYRSENGLWDLFGRKLGTVTWTRFNGKDVFGSNSYSPTYTSVDYAAAVRMRSVLLQKYPEIMNTNSIGRMPNDAVFHAETTVLLRAAGENGGTLAGRTLEVFADRQMCNSCESVLPKVGLELGNPTVIFVDPKGSTRTMRNGSWAD